MTYKKIENGRLVFSDCRRIYHNGEWIDDPTPEQIEAAGWEKVLPPGYVEPDPPEPYVPVPSTEPSMDEVMEAVKKMLSTSVESLTDEEALAVAALYPTFVSKIGKQVNTGERLWWDQRLWKVLQPHTVQDNWTPDTAVSLYVEVSIEEWPEWVQPLGAQDAYPLGAHVSHNGGHWESEIPDNVYEPGVYGWRQVD